MVMKSLMSSDTKNVRCCHHDDLLITSVIITTADRLDAMTHYSKEDEDRCRNTPVILRGSHSISQMKFPDFP